MEINMLKVEEIQDELREAFETLSVLKQAQSLIIRKYRNKKDLEPTMKWLESDLLPSCDKSLDVFERYIRRDNQQLTKNLKE